MLEEEADTPLEEVSSLNLDSPSPSQDLSPGESDDDFGDFDDFAGANVPNEDDEGQETVNEGENSLPKDNNAVNSQLTDDTFAAAPPSDGPKPLKSSELANLTVEGIRSLMAPPTNTTNESEQPTPETGDGTTPTSQALWQHLMEPAWMPLPKWEGSPIHRQLVVTLGLPLNLDESLPKSANNVRDALSLPTQNPNNDIEGLQHLPLWSSSMASEEALASMNDEELRAHLSKLKNIHDEAEKLRDAMESKEMDLTGEKNILEGMVESLLVFSQRKQRERLMKKSN